MGTTTLRTAAGDGTAPGPDGVELGVTPFGPFEMRWVESGPQDAPRFLLLHGIYAGAHSFEWRRLAPELIARARVRVPDLLGAGQSDRPPIEYTPQVLQRVVDALIDEAGPDVHVVASSLTGAYALRSVAAGHPATSLTLITPTGLGKPRERARADRSRLPFDVLERTPLGDLVVRALTSGPSVSWFQRNKTYRDPDMLQPDEVIETRRAGRLPGARHLQLAFVLDRLSIDLSPAEVARVRPEVIWATGQAFTEQGEADRWRDAGCRVELLPSGLPQVEEPGTVVELLTRDVPVGT